MPHKTFAEYDPEDTTALPCPCWMAGRNGFAGGQQPHVVDGEIDPSTFEHPDEYRDGVQARYEFENGI